ncbi:MAG: ABC transporter ATP-binding protein [Acidimicrobiia bacterium]|nr:MAG: ABC transporter ATP-binding protein [Acidimicrobiia bacterium]
MGESQVSTSALTKRFGDIVALDRVDLDVPPGIVYGLVGPNGAGKTTLLRILAGLREPTDGEVHVGARSVGVLPDTPRFDRWLTGREVVDLARSLTDRSIPASAVDEVLKVAGLADDAHRSVKGYSRGMLQRLGLASAVVTEPELLLLDEPAAALDPVGRREVLDLIAALAGHSTVVFSSHILDDVQEVCDAVGILRRGEMVYQGSLPGLLSRYVRNRYVVRVRSGENEIAASLLSESWVTSVDVEADGRLTVDVSDVDETERCLVSVLAASGRRVVSISPEATSLEEVFLEVTR